MEFLGNRSVSIPTTVFVGDDGSVLIGEAASRRGLEDPSRFAREFKRRVGDSAPLILGGSPYSAESLMARVLAWVVALVTERHDGGPDVVAVTHPANWGGFKKERLADAIAQAGLGDPRRGDAQVMTLSEPEAAARYYASTERIATGQLIAVYDLGGGTFDATVLEKTDDGFQIRGVPQGVEQLGGIDFDASILGHVDRVLAGAVSSISSDDALTRMQLARLRTSCIEAKEALSSDSRASFPVSLPNTETVVALSRAELETMIRAPLAESIDALRRALKTADVSPSDLDAVLLVGGSSRIPLVADLVARELGLRVAVDVHPKNAVALGAALAASQLESNSPQPVGVTTGVATAPVTAAPEAADANPQPPSSSPPPPPPSEQPQSQAPTQSPDVPVPPPVAPPPSQQPQSQAPTQSPDVPVQPPISPPPSGVVPPPLPPSESPKPVWKRPQVIIPVALVVVVAAVLGIVLSSSKKSNPPPPAVSPAATLKKLIPAQFNNNCKVQPRSNYSYSQEAAEIDCDAPTGSPLGQIWYTIFTNTANMNNAYSQEVSTANTSQGAQSCGSFTTFVAGCETSFGPANSSAQSGRIVEWTFTVQQATNGVPAGTTNPRITFTYGKDLVMVFLIGQLNAQGDPAVKYWNDNTFIVGMPG
jgi:actin-like ATPase involved in cell morphogenesis